MPYGDLPGMFLLCIFVAGLTAGAAAALNAAYQCYLAFTIPMHVLLVARLAYEQEPLSFVVAAAAAFFAVGLLAIAHNSRRETTKALRQWLVNRRLVRELRQARRRERFAHTEAASAALAREQAEAATAAKSRFVATVSHELRTPLNAVIGLSDVIADEFFGAVGNPRYRDYADEIRKSGERLLNMIDDILAFTVAEGAERPIFQLTPTQDLLESLVREFSLAGDDRHDRFHISVEPSDLAAYADPALLRQAMRNIVENAVKFSPSTTPIEMAASRLDDGRIRLRVRDQGIGIPPEKLSEVTAPFMQVDDSDARRHSGVGLGLTLVKQYVDLLGGELAISSENQDGVTVDVLLPAMRFTDVASVTRPAQIV